MYKVLFRLLQQFLPFRYFHCYMKHLSEKLLHSSPLAELPLQSLFLYIRSNQ
ncbi:hypothetical protein D3C71_1933680 [compost metagenome]